MSLRRKSCTTCFEAKRRCDLAQPSCKRCERNHKQCLYLYPSTEASETQSHSRSSAIAPRANTNPRRARRLLRPSGYLSPAQTLSPDFESLPPFRAYPDWDWVLSRIENFPRDFAQAGENLFIHKATYRDTWPRCLRVAFGACSTSAMLSKPNRPFLFGMIDAEMTDLLVAPRPQSLQEGLAMLQAMLLYQIIRVSHGNIEDRVLVEHQEYVVRSYALSLLHQAEEQVSSGTMPFEQWVLRESIRRTVLISFKLYTLYGVYRTGVCNEDPAFYLLPLSANHDSWDGWQFDLLQSNWRDTITVADMKTRWREKPRLELDQFERLIVEGSMGTSMFFKTFEDSLGLQISVA